MIRLILIVILLMLSLVNFFPVPTKETWYAGIAVPEFPWVFMLAVLILIFWSFFAKRYKIPGIILGAITFILLSYPIVRAYIIGNELDKNQGNIKKPLRKQLLNIKRN